jgi:hypothetical protein
MRMVDCNSHDLQTPINLENLLRQRQMEGERIECKAGWNPDAIFRTLCAFANAFKNLRGGYTVIGQDCDAAGMPVFPPVGLEENFHLDKLRVPKKIRHQRPTQAGKWEVIDKS